MDNLCDIRPAEDEDIPRLVEFRKKITQHSYRANPLFLRRSESAWDALPEQYRQWIASDEVSFLVAEHAGQVVAMVIGHDIRTDSLELGHLGEISDAWVEPAYRRHGLGRRLVHELARFFLAAGVEQVILDFGQGNREAEAFWLGLGLKPMLTAVAGDPREFVEATLPD